MTIQSKPFNQINRREFIGGVSASALALNTGALTFGFGSPAHAEPTGTRNFKQLVTLSLKS